jgi:hypothetical protein
MTADPKLTGIVSYTENLSYLAVADFGIQIGFFAIVIHKRPG